MGQGIGGQYAGTQLTFLPAQHVDWQTWLELHPDTLVISPSLYGRDPYEGYYTGATQGVIGRSGGDRDGDLHPKEYVIGVRLGGETKAYPFSVLSREPVVNDRVGQIPVAVLFDKDTVSGNVYDRQLGDGTVLTFAPGPSPRRVIDTETRSEWDTLTGVAVSGELAGTQLDLVPVTYSFWFGWIDYHTDTEVYAGS